VIGALAHDCLILQSCSEQSASFMTRFMQKLTPERAVPKASTLRAPFFRAGIVMFLTSGLLWCQCWFFEGNHPRLPHSLYLPTAKSSPSTWVT
jgi:hypothetical protein